MAFVTYRDLSQSLSTACSRPVTLQQDQYSEPVFEGRLV
jgi:hypothetical protein